MKEPWTWQPLGSTATIVGASGDGGTASINLPFQVQYFGTNYNTLNVSVNGVANFGTVSTSHTPSGFLTSSTPNGSIAPWWADFDCPAGGIKSQTIGTSPTRSFAVEWICPSWGSSYTGTAQMQIWFFEGSSTIEFRYGAGSGTWLSDKAAMGIESPTGNERFQVVGARGTTCGETCLGADFPQNSLVRFARDADLIVDRVDVPARAWGGVEIDIEAAYRNAGGKDAVGFDISFYLSADTTLQTSGANADVLLHTMPGPAVMAPSQEEVVAVRPVVPPNTVPGTYYVLVQLDPGNVVREGSESNNVRASASVLIEQPTPDLLVEAITLPTEPQLDGNLAFSWTMRNRGAAPAVDVPYVIVASFNDYNSNYDVTLASGTATIAALVALEVDEVVALPGDLLAGAYHIGVIVDPDNVIFEPDETNNLFLSTERVLLGTDTVIAATLDLPDAHVGSNYCVLLEGAGGDGSYVWSLVSGELPPGLALEEERAGADLTVPPLATMLCGRPSQVGSYAFTLEVSSAGISARRDFDLAVVPASGMPLTPATLVLHDAIAFEDYRAQLNAVGGVPPFEWSLVSGTLPAGLKLDKSGRLHGVATEAGVKTFVVQVKDSATGEESVELSLNVASPTRLTCMTKTLPSVEVGTGFGSVIALQAAGGSAPYTWSTIESRRLPTPLDEGRTHTGAEPPGLTLSSNGEVRGTAEVAGRYLWMVEVRGSDSVLKDTCAITFDVTYSQGLTVTTTTLVDAYAGVPYEAMLSAMGGVGDLVWSAPEDGGLPVELELGENGVLSGVLPLSLLEGKSSRIFPFKVLVRDEENRIGVASLSVRLFDKQPAPPETDGGSGNTDDDGGGCQAAGGDLGLLAFGTALGFAALRRRRA